MSLLTAAFAEARFASRVAELTLEPDVPEPPLVFDAPEGEVVDVLVFVGCEEPPLLLGVVLLVVVVVGFVVVLGIVVVVVPVGVVAVVGLVVVVAIGA